MANLTPIQERQFHKKSVELQPQVPPNQTTDYSKQLPATAEHQLGVAEYASHKHYPKKSNTVIGSIGDLYATPTNIKN